MAVRKFILSFGQSNGGPSPEYVTWIQKHPELDLRLVVDPTNKYANSPYGSYNDQFTIPGSFYGYSSVSLFGRAVRAIRYLTHYHPLSTGYPTYPCVGRVMSGSTSTALLVSTLVPNSGASGANAFPIVRQSNGRTYNVTSTQERTFSAQINAGNVSAYFGIPSQTAHLVVGDKFRFLNVGTNTTINTATDYVVKTTSGNDFTFGVWPSGATITGLTVTATTIDLQFGANAVTRFNLSSSWDNPAVNEQFDFSIYATATSSSAPVSPQHQCTFNVSAGGFWAGTYLGCKLQRVSSGEMRTVVGGTGTTIIYDSEFTTGGHLSAGDQLKIVSPTGAFNKWSMFLPWSPFEGLTEQTKLGEPPILFNNPNPYPPGFNYPNHWHVPTTYFPFAQTNGLTPNGVSYHVGLASAIQNAIAEDIYVIASDFGGSSLAHNEQAAGAGSYGWHDPKQQSSWSPSEPNNCFARLMDELDSAVAAAAAQGDTLECLGLFFIQGESDSAYPSMADRYGYNLRAFKTRIRAEIKARGLWTGDASHIPWVHPQISLDYPGWVYADEVNLAIQQEAENDRYMRTFSADGIELKPPGDEMHYSGAGAVTLEQRCYSAWQSIRSMEQQQNEAEIAVCNLALSHIGDSAEITSIDPPDGSVQATHCARYYPIARDSLLDMKGWSFATKRKSLVAIENTRSEWAYAYLAPADCTTGFAILPPDSPDDYSVSTVPDWPTNIAVNVAAGAYVPQPFSTETDEFGRAVIYTNQADAVIRYTASGTDASKFSPLFTVALSWHLASMLAGPIIKGDVGAAEAKRCAQMAQYFTGQADESDSGQRMSKPNHIVPWMSGR